MTTEHSAGPATGPGTQDPAGRGIVDLDARVVEATVGLVKQAGLLDLDRPTPCAGWTLADLIAHMTAQHYGWIAAAVGHGADLSAWQPGPPVADPIGEYAEAARRVLEVFGEDDVLDREFALAEISPVLRFPAAQAISFHFIDYLVHGWDVARSLGADYRPGPDVLAAALPVALAVPGGKARERDGAAFAPVLEVPAQAGTLDQILALLGRRPSWPR
jgi:uncharacterized protein (TIGR03086 family)